MTAEVQKCTTPKGEGDALMCEAARAAGLPPLLLEAKGVAHIWSAYRRAALEVLGLDIGCRSDQT